MNIKEVKTKKLYKEYSLEIPFEDIDKEIDLKIKNLIPTITIPGFRKGKAPLNIVKKKYEDSVLNEVIQNVVNTKTSELIKEKKYQLFRQPKVDLKKFEKNQPVEIEIKIDLQPEINLKDFKQLKLNKYEIELPKKTIDENYSSFLNNQKSFEKLNNKRLIKKTDKVIINFATLDENVPEYLRSQKNIPIDTDLDQEYLPGINNQLISKLKEGDKKNIFLDLSTVLKNNKLKKVSYEIEVISVEKKVNFVVTEEYLNKNGFKTETDLKDFLKNNNLQQYQQGIAQIEKKQLMDLLNKEYNIDLPEGVLEEDFNEIWHRLENAKKDGTLDEDDKSLSEDKLKKRYKKISERRVKLGVILQFIAKEQKITLSENEISRGIMQYTSQYPGQEKQIMEYLKKNPSSIESIKGPLLENKIIDSIKSKATIVNRKIDDKQYKKLEEETFDIKKEKI
ncbi:trigger factor [Pelagibacteraceae bacterium]|nr:trigger factor [Pelagibacteraceae bacterium]